MQKAISFLTAVVLAQMVSAAGAGGGVVSLFNGDRAVNATVGPADTRGALEARLFYDCKGSSLCKGLGVDQCDAAFRTIIPGNIYNTLGAAGDTGVCSGHCGIFVQGEDCSYTGNDLQNAYHNLRANGCQKCGSEHEENGCFITINYVTGC